VRLLAHKPLNVLRVAQQWDLNTGQRIRDFTAHGAQLAAIAVRPLVLPGARSPSPMEDTPTPANQNGDMKMELKIEANEDGDVSMRTADDVRSEGSYDDLFDEPDGLFSEPPPAVPPPWAAPAADGGWKPPPVPPPAAPQSQPRAPLAPKMPPVLGNGVDAADFSSDLLMTASVDGQVVLWDVRVNESGKGVGRLWMHEKTPPWCMSVSVSIVIWVPL
jgi:transcriptional activator SPT8